MTAAKSPPHKENAETNADGPVFSGCIITEGPGPKEKETITAGSAWYSKEGNLVITGGKKTRVIQAPAFARPMTGKDGFTIRISGVGTLRFCTGENPSAHPFFQKCQNKSQSELTKVDCVSKKFTTLTPLYLFSLGSRGLEKEKPPPTDQGLGMSARVDSFMKQQNGGTPTNGRKPLQIASFGRPVKPPIQTTLQMSLSGSDGMTLLSALPSNMVKDAKVSKPVAKYKLQGGVKEAVVSSAADALESPSEPLPSKVNGTTAPAEPLQESLLSESNSKIPPPASDTTGTLAKDANDALVADTSPLRPAPTTKTGPPVSAAPTSTQKPTPIMPAPKSTPLTPATNPFLIEADPPPPSLRSRSPVRTTYGYPIKRPGSSLPEQRHTKYRLDRSPPRSEGIRNLGQTCYMAASLQMLYSLPFTTNFQAIVASLERKGLGGGTLWACISQIFRLRDNCKLVSVLPLRKTLSDLIQQFNDDRQEDAQEFLTAILSLLKNELRSVQVPRGRAPIGSFFEWTAERTLECKACHNTSHGSEPFDTMPLDLHAQMGRRASLSTLVFAFFKGGAVDWKCTKCGATEASKSYCMRDLPPVIIVHLKRFWLDTKVMAIRKRNDPVEIPLTLDLGHYVADVYDSATDLWTCFDDTNVTKGQRNIEQKRDRTVYLLAYVKDDGGGGTGD
ncbi:Ubiquitin carboxyl-terminal hydrolase 37 [Geranomyces variabilis]|uniref:Ubiquitin carboxyl-terminal hydrolase 37 n=1 Tax=Geranomyces variabilis TaxID=109894 RepID=A0AAD5TD94_9FUNG|nr:Ubiquitin carboxyl-terminal hydrolase 37 [Geranomyces variabilis]